MEQKQHFIGLTDSEVLVSRQKNGENLLTPPKKESLWSQFFEKFKDPIIRILLIALLLSVGISCYEYFTGTNDSSVFFEPFGIFVAVILATGIGFWFEVKASKAFDVLNQVNDENLVQVIRNQNVSQISKKEVVVGDVVILNAGEEVPADGELLEAVTLQINESTLTGEPIIKKTIDKERFDEEATYPSNYVMRGTTVVEGHAICKILNVGDATEYGKVYVAAQIDNSVKTPLSEQLDGLGNVITKISYAIAVLILVGRMIVYFHTFNAPFNWFDFGTYFLNTFMIAVTLIVVAVPEGLPMSVTLSLALSMRRMLKTNNLVRKMHACETMGATTVICTDKTGTLTQNQMRIFETKFYGLEDQILADNEMSRLIAEGIAVNATAFLDFSDSQKIKVLGNPTEGALLLWLHDNQVDYSALRQNAKILDQLTFSTERKYMATIVFSPTLKQKVVYVKGAPEIVYSLCKQTVGNVTKGEIHEQLLGYQNQAMRTLGFAYQVISNEEGLIKEGKIFADNLTFLGISAISDPIRKDVPAAIKECLDAGIQIKIVTGDTPGTAREIGRQIGLWKDGDGDKNQITGPEFAALSDEDLNERVLDFKIISRARPMDKLRLVKTLQSKGQVVAVTGDGTNDAPALNAAQIGLSMGDGTSVAKEASDITIVDNSFGSITRAVMWGRSLYQNIQRFILFQMTINVAACVIVIIGAFLGTQSPLTVTQMLWVNLIMDTFAAMALASLPPTEEVMKDAPRKRTDFIINKSMWWGIFGVGGIFVFLLFGLLQYFKYTDVGSLVNFNFSSFFENIFKFSVISDDKLLSPYELSMFFTVFVMLQFWNLFNARAFKTGRSAFHLAGCQGFLFILFAIFFGQILLVSIGGEMFNVVPIHLIDWLIIVVSTSLVLWIGEIIRLFRR